VDPYDLTRKYQDNIGQHPLRDTAALAGIAGLGTYLFSGPILRLLVQSAGSFGGPQTQQAVQEYLAPGGDLSSSKLRLAALAALSAGGYGVYKHGDWKGGLQALKNSMMDKDYWKKNPDRSAAYKPAVPETLRDMEEKAIDMDKQAWGMEEGFSKNPFYREDIPVGQSINVIRQDPILFQQNRSKIAGLIVDSTNDKVTSQYNLTNAAVRAGVDFGTAYLFGQGVGRLLALPDPIVNRVSAAGGIAAAVIGSGVLKHM